MLRRVYYNSNQYGKIVGEMSKRIAQVLVASRDAIRRAR